MICNLHQGLCIKKAVENCFSTAFLIHNKTKATIGSAISSKIQKRFAFSNDIFKLKMINISCYNS
ncbi:hypothetical protein BWI92_01635 [Flectobacillus sp. BAB-3569]|nr:hypothetical protein BWI92_01635 [Flectobacillus sp. BAB-3569]